MKKTQTLTELTYEFDTQFKFMSKTEQSAFIKKVYEAGFRDGGRDEFRAATKERNEKLIENNWHIGDGCDDCAGWDYEAMENDFGVKREDYYGK